MKKTLKVLIVVTIAISMLTACGSDKKTSKISGNNINTSNNSSTSLDNLDSSSSEEDRSSLAEKEIPLTTQAPQVTTQTPPQTTAPKVTTKATTTTKAPQQVTQPPATTQAPQRQLVAPNAAQCAVIENEIMRLVNEYRASLGVAPCTVETKLIQGARIRAAEASTPNNFGHTRPDGSKWGTVLDQVQYGVPYIEYYYGQNGEILSRQAYNYGAAAENLTGFSNNVIGQNYFECSDAELKAVAQEMFNGWKASPDHNKSMINTIYTKMGVGVYAIKRPMTNGDIAVTFFGIQLFTMD